MKMQRSPASPYPDDLRFRQCFRILKAECKSITYSFTNFPVSAEMRRIYCSLQMVQDYGVNLISVEEGIDSSQASGKLLISVLSAVAEIERKKILEQTMNGRREKARQGL